MDWLMVIAAYCVGAIPFGLLISKKMGVDIRQAGSGNIGATNVLRTAGRLGGALTLLGDALKGFLPVVIAREMWGLDAWTLGVALAAVIGHTFPIYLRFKGGKGVATGFGVIFGLWPWVGVVTLGVWLLSLAAWRYSSLSALMAFGGLPLITRLMVSDPEGFLFSAVLTGLIFYRHQENIRRLWHGEEKKIGTGD
jgi:glycerol-3-phosphate acyltransferase PlsY